MRDAKQIISLFYTAARDQRNIVERKIRVLRSVAISQTAIRFFQCSVVQRPSRRKNSAAIHHFSDTRIEFCCFSVSA